MEKKCSLFWSGSQQVGTLSVGIFKETFQFTKVCAKVKEPQGLLRYSGISSIRKTVHL